MCQTVRTFRIFSTSEAHSPNTENQFSPHFPQLTL
uniref:Uncharacterized protein n=1 Tax=Anguilla anguilla TaxID=7936 RepID=A0A0E9S5U9_ANGAN